jgi:hypothetical protein
MIRMLFRFANRFFRYTLDSIEKELIQKFKIILAEQSMIEFSDEDADIILKAERGMERNEKLSPEFETWLETRLKVLYAEIEQRVQDAYNLAVFKTIFLQAHDAIHSVERLSVIYGGYKMAARHSMRHKIEEICMPEGEETAEDLIRMLKQKMAETKELGGTEPRVVNIKLKPPEDTWEN